MRVAQVCPYSLTIPGGVQTQVLGLARALRELGHEARVLAPCDGPPPDSGTTPLGASVPLAANGSVAPIAPDAACALRTIRVLRDEGFDLVHLHEPLVPGPTLTALLFSDAPILATFHRSGESNAYEKLRGPVQWAAEKIDLRVAVSPEAAQTAKEALGGDYEIAFNGIEIARFANALPTPKRKQTIFFIGRHEPRKGLAVLLDALRFLGDDVVLWIAGTGPQTMDLQQQTAGDTRVEWLGRLSDIELASRMAGADVLCAPSLGGESFGVILLEAMAARTPIVCSDIPGYRNAARFQLDAAFVEPNNPGALAKALTHVLSNSAYAAQLVASGSERATEYAMPNLAKLYVELYERVLERATPQRAMTNWRSIANIATRLTRDSTKRLRPNHFQ